jgi:hypothetical protein
MFKEKNTKKRIVVQEYSKEKSTLDARHQNMIQKMSFREKTVSELRDKKIQVNNQLSSLQDTITKFKEEENTECDEYNNIWNTIINLRDELRNIDNTISANETNIDEIEYYEKTGNILFKYYDLLEKQDVSEISTIIPPPIRQMKGRKKQAPIPSRTILEAFAMKTEETTNNTTASGNNDVKDKSSLVDDYMAVIDSNHLKNTDDNMLGNCPRCELQLACVQQEGAMVCVDCGYQELLLVEQNRPMIRQPSKDASHFSYKRINHFREWLSQVQGKESTDIPEEIFEKILQEIKKEKIQDTNKLSYNKMREILKKLKINRYYEHINYIINRINGVPTPNFSPELEDKLCNMFKEIQAPFLRHCPQSRKNFLSYSFCIHKLIQILGLHDYLKYFTLLRSREKLYIQDQIWKKICEDLGWPMYPSL